MKIGRRRKTIRVNIMIILGYPKIKPKCLSNSEHFKAIQNSQKLTNMTCWFVLFLCTKQTNKTWLNIWNGDFFCPRTVTFFSINIFCNLWIPVFTYLSWIMKATIFISIFSLTTECRKWLMLSEEGNFFILNIGSLLRIRSVTLSTDHSVSLSAI